MNNFQILRLNFSWDM